LCLLFCPKTVHCSTKNAYTSEITFLALQPWWEWKGTGHAKKAVRGGLISCFGSSPVSNVFVEKQPL